MSKWGEGMKPMPHHAPHPYSLPPESLHSPPPRAATNPKRQATKSSSPWAPNPTPQSAPWEARVWQVASRPQSWAVSKPVGTMAHWMLDGGPDQRHRDQGLHSFPVVGSSFLLSWSCQGGRMKGEEDKAFKGPHAGQIKDRQLLKFKKGIWRPEQCQEGTGSGAEATSLSTHTPWSLRTGPPAEAGPLV